MGNAGVTVLNQTNYPLNIYLSMIAPHHFCNGLRPGEAFTIYPGAVWYTVNAYIDHVDNRISSKYVASSCGAIAIGSVCVALGAVALPLAELGAVSLGAGVAGLSYLANEFGNENEHRVEEFIQIANQSKLYTSLKNVYCGDTHKVLAVYGGPRMFEDYLLPGDFAMDYIHHSEIPQGCFFRKKDGIYNQPNEYWSVYDDWYPRKKF